MITDEQFKKYIDQMSDAYEDLKDHACATMDQITDVMDHYEKLAKFRDIACIALRESHTTKNFDQN
jgi:hypothetical protein